MRKMTPRRRACGLVGVMVRVRVRVSVRVRAVRKG